MAGKILRVFFVVFVPFMASCLAYEYRGYSDPRVEMTYFPESVSRVRLIPKDKPRESGIVESQTFPYALFASVTSKQDLHGEVILSRITLTDLESESVIYRSDQQYRENFKTNHNGDSVADFLIYGINIPYVSCRVDLHFEAVIDAKLVQEDISFIMDKNYIRKWKHPVSDILMSV